MTDRDGLLARQRELQEAIKKADVWLLRADQQLSAMLEHLAKSKAARYEARKAYLAAVDSEVVSITQWEDASKVLEDTIEVFEDATTKVSVGEQRIVAKKQMVADACRELEKIEEHLSKWGVLVKGDFGGK